MFASSVLSNPLLTQVQTDFLHVQLHPKEATYAGEFNCEFLIWLIRLGCNTIDKHVCPHYVTVMPWWSFVNGVHLPGSRTRSFNNEPPSTRWTWLHDSAQGRVLLDSPEPIRNTQTLVAQTCPGNEFALSCIMRASMGAVWLHQGRVWHKKGRLEGGNAGFNEMWVCAASTPVSSGLWRGLTGVRRGRAWISHNRSLKLANKASEMTSPAPLSNALRFVSVSWSIVPQQRVAQNTNQLVLQI